MASSISGSATMSVTAKRPPGRSTRAASRKTWGLSAERLMTQFEMTTSTDSSGSGICSIVPFMNSTFSTPGRALVAAGQLEHLVGHVESVRLAGRADPAGRQQDVDPAAGAEIEDRLALVELGDGRRVSAAERGELRRVGERVALLAGVELGAEDVPSWSARAFVPQPHEDSAGRSSRRRPRSRPWPPRRSARAPPRGCPRSSGWDCSSILLVRGDDLGRKEHLREVLTRDDP